MKTFESCLFLHTNYNAKMIAFFKLLKAKNFRNKIFREGFALIKQKFSFHHYANERDLKEIFFRSYGASYRLED